MQFLLTVASVFAKYEKVSCVLVWRMVGKAMVSKDVIC